MRGDDRVDAAGDPAMGVQTDDSRVSMSRNVNLGSGCMQRGRGAGDDRGTIKALVDRPAFSHSQMPQLS